MLIKSPADIKKLKAGGKILGGVVSELVKMCQPGIDTWSIDRKAEELIIEAGGRPSFKLYKNHPTDPPFPATICASLNDEIVHGIPKKEVILKSGDIFTIDIGMEWPYGQKDKKGKLLSGLYTDTAITVPIGSVGNKIAKLLNVTAESLEEGIRAVKPGAKLSSVCLSIENYIKSQGSYGIIKDLSGHGVGHAVHEEPCIPNYYDRYLDNFIIKPGMVFALEPMITEKGWRIMIDRDGWTIKTANGAWCAHFEHTLVVNNKGCEVITRRPEEM